MNEQPATIPPTTGDPQADLLPVYGLAVRILTWGFRVAAALLALGIVLAIVQNDGLSEKAEPLSQIVTLLRDGHAAGVIDLAIIAIVLTPASTVVAILISFIRLHDRRYTIISLFVLCIVGISIAISLLR